MKRYEYVPIENTKMFGAKFEGHREIINEYAEKGYRYVGYIPSEIAGILIKFDLVFEKEK